MARHWSALEERVVIDCAGKCTAEELARILGRSYQSVVMKAYQMRCDGLIDTGLRPHLEDEFVSELETCVECGERRSTCNEHGVCKVCRDTKILDAHIERMHKSYANLPQELKERTNGTFELQRTKALMKYELEKPKPPELDGLTPFWQEAALDEYHRAMESYELRILRLDIDAAKQRRSKWNRKAVKYREEHGGMR